MKELEVFLYNKKLGNLIEVDGIIHFSIETSWDIYNKNVSPLVLKPGKNTLYSNKENMKRQGLLGCFFDSLPDKYGMTLMDNYFKTQNIDPNYISLLDRLMFIGDRGIGALEYKPKLNDDIIEEKIISVKYLKDYSRKILNEEMEDIGPTTISNIVDTASPIGGGRPKIMVLYNYSTKEIMYNVENKPKNFKRSILKFDEEIYGKSKGTTKIEYVYMNLLKELGVNTPKVSLIEDNNETHFLIDRFDRDEQDNKIHVTTAASLLEKEIFYKNHSSYEELFRLTKILTKNQQEIEELYIRMIFNLLSFNNDDHLKNFSYIMEENGNWKLSPVYDVTYSVGATTREHLISLNGKNSNFQLNDFLKIAKDNNIKDKTAKNIIKDVISKIEEIIPRISKLGVLEQTISGMELYIYPQLEEIKKNFKNY